MTELAGETIIFTHAVRVTDTCRSKLAAIPFAGSSSLLVVCFNFNCSLYLFGTTIVGDCRITLETKASVHLVLLCRNFKPCRNGFSNIASAVGRSSRERF